MDEQDEIKNESDALPQDEVPDDSETTETNVAEKFARMREELRNCRREKQEYMDGWQRAKADYVNALKRFAQDGKAAELKGKVRAVETLLPAFDALERAKEHGEIPEGFLAIARQLETAFAILGLEEVGKIGEKFDPALHEALGQDETDVAEMDDTIIAILEKGWKIGDSIIRAAKVRVAHFEKK
jgi:molecular chaperone GrpE